MNLYKASCLCGSIQIEITGPIKHVTHCHCTMCQKAHGAAFATFAAARDEHFNIVAGTDVIQSYQSSPNVVRTFCKNCGSNIQWMDDSTFNMGWSSFALALLDTEFNRDKQKHIYIKSKADWLTLADHHPKCQEYDA